MRVQKYVRYEKIHGDDLPFVENDAYARVLCPRWYFEFPCSLFRRGPAYTSQDLLAEDWLRYHGLLVISPTSETSPILKAQTNTLFTLTIYVDWWHDMWRINFWKRSKIQLRSKITIVDVNVNESLVSRSPQEYQVGRLMARKPVNRAIRRNQYSPVPK